MQASANIATAGAYICVGDAYLFALGPNPTNTALAVFRIGGHCEVGESPWACAAREALEEAAIQLEPIAPPATYWLDRDNPEQRLQAINPPCHLAHPVAPCLIVTAQAETGLRMSVMYLAETIDQPIPCAEMHGLMLLRAHEIQHITQQPTTLQQHVQSGGQAFIRTVLDTTLVLQPLAQLRVLAELLQRYPALTRIV